MGKRTYSTKEQREAAALALAFKHDMTRTQHAVLLMMINRVKGEFKGTIGVSNAELSRLVGVSVGTLQNAILALVEAELVKVEPRYRNGERISNRYHLKIPKKGNLQPAPAGWNPPRSVL